MAEERQTNWTIGETAELPSKGLIYDKPINATVELRSMTARDEMKRQNPSTSQFKKLADIIEGCLIEKPAVHVYDMALGDYEFLLHKLRIITYSDDYKMELTCPHCLEQIEATAHLNELQVRPFDVDKFKESLTVHLDKSDHVVTLKFQTPRMLDEIDARTRELKRKFKDADVVFDLLVLLESVIDTVDGEKLNIDRLDGFINKLPAADMKRIVNTVDKLNAMIGLDTRLLITCDKCGGEVPVSFRFGPEFFGPSDI